MVCYVFGNPRLIWNEGTTLLYGEVIMSCNAYSSKATPCPYQTSVNSNKQLLTSTDY